MLFWNLFRNTLGAEHMHFCLKAYPAVLLLPLQKSTILLDFLYFVTIDTILSLTPKLRVGPKN